MSEKNKVPEKYQIFLGGHDAEMATIKTLAQEQGLTFHDANLGWGPDASAYEEQIQEALKQGYKPVLVELKTASLSNEVRDQIVNIDHHGERAQEAASVIQFAELIGAPISRLHELIAANDTGYIPAMMKAGATPQEIAQIRLLDRSEQGIKPEQEAQTEEALKKLERYPELNDLIIVRLPHSKTATVTDRLFGSQSKENILIISEDGEMNYYGDGELCDELEKKFKGWKGGSGLGKKGEIAFWGGNPNQKEVEDFIKESLKS